MNQAQKTLTLYSLAINYAVSAKTRAEALDIITDEREKRGENPNTKEAGTFFNAVRDLAEKKASTKEKTAQLWALAKKYAGKI